MGCNPMVEDGKVVGFICSPTPRDEKKKFYKCRKCKKRRLHLIKHYEWYAPTGKCLKCKTPIYFEE